MLDACDGGTGGNFSSPGFVERIEEADDTKLNKKAEKVAPLLPTVPSCTLKAELATLREELKVEQERRESASRTLQLRKDMVLRSESDVAELLRSHSELELELQAESRRVTMLMSESKAASKATAEEARLQVQALTSELRSAEQDASRRKELVEELSQVQPFKLRVSLTESGPDALMSRVAALEADEARLEEALEFQQNIGLEINDRVMAAIRRHAAVKLAKTRNPLAAKRKAWQPAVRPAAVPSDTVDVDDLKAESKRLAFTAQRQLNSALRLLTVWTLAALFTTICSLYILDRLRRCGLEVPRPCML